MQLGDARKLDQRTQAALRQRAVLLVQMGDNLRVHHAKAVQDCWRATRTRSRFFISRRMRRSTTRMNVSTTI